jgi:hypothetical protein
VLSLSFSLVFKYLLSINILRKKGMIKRLNKKDIIIVPIGFNKLYKEKKMVMRNEVVECGDEVRDKVSGFTGIVVAKYSYLFGCNRFCLQPEVDKDNALKDCLTFDEYGSSIN